MTYKDIVTDTEKLYRDFKRFNRRCRTKFGHYEYIAAAEFQRRASLHLHFVAIFDHAAPFMENKIVAELWGHGFVNVRKLTGIDDVGRYLTAYLGDATLDELGGIPNLTPTDRLKAVEIEENGVKVKKAVIKGARLALMPPNFKLYRISKNIKKPTVTRMTSADADNRFQDWEMTHETTYKLTDENRDFTNITNKRYYNKLRGQK